MVRSRTDPTGGGGRYFRHMVRARTVLHRSSRSDVRSTWTTVQGKPVARRGRKARDLPSGRPPGCRRPTQVRRPSRWCREGEPGALHRGPGASGDHGPYSWRGDEVVLAMNTLFVAAL